MQQVFSNEQTIYIQAAFSVVVMGLGIWLSYEHGLVPNVGGWLGWAEFVVIFWGWSFAGASIVGGVMWVANLFYYQVQVLRHGRPTEQVEADVVDDDTTE